MNKKHVLAAIMATMMLSACNKMQFSQMDLPSSDATSVTPVAPIIPEAPVVIPEEPVTAPPAPTFSFKMNAGICASDSSTQLVSCLNCEVPQVVQEPQLSKKAQALLDIMTLSCDIKNRSDQTNYRPTRAEILNKLNRASESVYPDSPRTALIEQTIAGLTDPNNNSLRQYMFGGLYYRPPYSDAFETYFGMTVPEAKATFCWYGDKMTGRIEYRTGVGSKEYFECTYIMDPMYCRERPEYVRAQTYRAQLESALQLSVTSPYKAPAAVAGPTCKWETFEGDDLVEAKKVIARWKSEGRKVSMETLKGGNIGLCSSADAATIQDGTTVKIGSYNCK